ncbi:hypothetical protein ONS95_010971 [Cadophora gregata]|uniref:uncharacterized protein n=1 Tax=Cadophora gregata TaxID=51156 RepID=UPI0026DC65A4|nr:uncharacterized protein ONS95_010971 [Cadophora gregata]KAK0119529.1 hypothetical protein ONS95_010971 [Cadophora gregata]KAK0120570.1 hypothetical protein ONS96_010774 [Cadophora gregata f. sp. sojae]
MASVTAPPTAGTSLEPILSPSLPADSLPPTACISKPHKIELEPELPHPSPSVEDISGFPRINTGYITEPSEDDSEADVAAYPYPNSSSNRSPSPRRSADPFASQRSGGGIEGNPFRFDARERSEAGDGGDDEGPRPERACGKQARRLGDESDVSKATPSRIQHSNESRLTTPSSQDKDDTKSPEGDSKRHSGVFEKGWAKMTGRSSKGGND